MYDANLLAQRRTELEQFVTSTRQRLAELSGAGGCEEMSTGCAGDEVKLDPLESLKRRLAEQIEKEA